ncbi:MAG: hypothetical protein IJX94_04620, partial [Clostridia bacterium]|nr:hypothetical protein [Clostridia bacterium]
MSIKYIGTLFVCFRNPRQSGGVSGYKKELSFEKVQFTDKPYFEKLICRFAQNKRLPCVKGAVAKRLRDCFSVKKLLFLQSL